MNTLFTIKKRRETLFSSFFLLFSFAALHLNAQDYYFESYTIDSIIFQNEIDLFAKINIPFVNNLDSYTTFQWIKNEVNVPENWQISMCDESICYEPEIQMGLSNIAANSSYNFALQIYPFNSNNEIDLNSGSVTLEVAADIDNIQFVTIDFEVVAITTNQFVIKNTIKISPNPCSTYINIEGFYEENVAQIKVYDLSAKFLIQSYESSFDVSQLNKGTYMLKFLDAQQQLISVEKLIVQ